MGSNVDGNSARSRGARGGAVGSTYELTRQVRTIVADVCDLDHDVITLDTPFSDYGVESLRRFELATVVEDVFGIDIPSDVAQRLTSVRAVVQEIETQSGEEDDGNEDREPPVRDEPAVYPQQDPQILENAGSAQPDRP